MLEEKIKENELNIEDYDFLIIPGGKAVFNDLDNAYRRKERNLLYVACTRCQHELIIYN